MEAHACNPSTATKKKHARQQIAKIPRKIPEFFSSSQRRFPHNGKTWLKFVSKKLYRIFGTINAFENYVNGYEMCDQLFFDITCLFCL